MSKKTEQDYWRDRFKQLEEAQNRKGRECYEEIEEIYNKAIKKIEAKIAIWYQRFADNNNIDLTEARKILTLKELEELKWDVQEYIKYGKENDINEMWIKELENASARYHVTRYEALKLQIQQQLEVIYDNKLDIIDRTMRSIYKDRYYKTAFEIEKGLGVGYDFATIDQRKIDKVIKTPWAVDGKNFSERIWGDKQKLIKQLQTEMTTSMITGESPHKLIDRISKKLNVSKKETSRLVMTEQAYFSSVAQKDCFNELDVEQYEIVATLDSSTSDICRELDGKTFPMIQYEAGVTAPPFHVYCRSVTVPYFGDEFDTVGKRAERGTDGKTHYVDSNMTYEEWLKKRKNKNDDNNAYNDITEEWLSNKNDNYEFVELKKYKINEELYIVDNKHVILKNSEKEKSVAKLLLDNFGGKIEMVPRIVYPQNKSTPDYLFNGEKYDLKEPIGESKNVLYNMVSKKKTQANNFIFDVTNCPINEFKIIKQIDGLFKSKHTKFIDKVILIKNNKVIGVYKRK